MKVLLTGAAGFLGWHAQVRLRAVTDHEVIPVTRSSWPDLARLVTGADAVLHVAGVNRGPDEAVRCGNLRLAEELRAAVLASGSRPRLVFANSIRAGDSSPYGDSKAGASAVLQDLADTLGSAYVDVRLPNLFGEHGRSGYNSFVATFVEAVLGGRTPTIDDRPISLLHAQPAAQVLIDALNGTSRTIEPLGTATGVREVWDRLTAYHALYVGGDIPALQTDLDLDLFNTLRAALFPAAYPIPLTTRTDARGSLVELVRAHGGQGQTFVSTTGPGETRGEHFHLRKVERFVVISGRAQISLRRMCSDQAVTFSVDGIQPGIVDMPTLWTHNITNVGSSQLTTVFWTNELFDPNRPDTYPEPVVPVTALVAIR